MRTQTDDIRNYILNHPEGITTKVAYDLFGCTRLADVVWRLKKNGMRIVTETKSVKNRYGGNSQVAVYKIYG